MANYSYGGLSVSVSADTRALTSQIGTASRAAGAKASANISGQLTRGLGGIAKSTGRALGSVAAIGTGAMVAFAGSAIKAGVAYNVLYSSSLKAFTTILGSQKAASKMMSDIEKFGKTSPFPRQAFIKASQQMLAFGYQAKDVIPTLTAVQDAVAATGGSADDINGIVTVLSKVKSSGKITAETLNQLGDRGVNAAELIGKGMGKSAGDIRSQITAGSLDANKALSILTVQMEAKYKGAAGGLKSTWTGAKDSIKGAMRDIGSAVVEPFISKKGGGLAIEWANKFSATLWKIKPAVEPLVNALMQSMQPAINGLNTGVNWLIVQIDKLTNPKSLPAATNAVKKFGAVGLAAFGGMSAVMGGALLSQLPMVGPLFSGLVGPIKAVGVALTGLSAPVLIVVIAIAALVALVTIASPRFRQAVGGFAKAFMVALKPAIDAIIAGFKMLLPIIMNFGKILGDNLAPIIQKLMPLLAPLGKLLAVWAKILFKELAVAFKVLGVVLSILLPILGWLIGLLVPIINVIVKLVTWVLNLVAAVNQIAVVQAVFNAIGTAAKNMGGWFVIAGQAVAVAWSAIVGGITTAVNAIIGVIMPAWNWIASVTMAVFNVIVTIIQVAWQVILTAVTIYIILVKAVILLWWTVVSAITTAIWGVIGQYVIAVWNWILNIARIVWAAIGMAISAVWTVIQIAVTAALLWLQATVSVTWNWILAFTRVLWGAIGGAIMGALNVIRWAVGTVLGWMQVAIGAAWAVVKAITSVIWAQITAAVTAAWNTIKLIVNTAIAWIKWLITTEWNGILVITRAIWGVIGGAVMAVWNGIKAGIGAALGWIKSTMAAAWNSAFATVKSIWGQIGGWIGNIWKTIKDQVGKSAGAVIEAMKKGFTDALKNIGDWIKKNIVDPIVNAVKSHFGLSTGGGAPPAKGKSAGGQMAAAATGGPQGGGGTGGGVVGGHAAASAAGAGGSLVSAVPTLFNSLIHMVIGSNPLGVATHIFGSVAEALGWMVVKGLAAIESLGKGALDALGKIPGVSDVLGMFGAAFGAVKGFIGGLFGGGGGGKGSGGVGALLSRAMSFNGHRYVWGGNADAKTGFDCSSFVNMLAMGAGLPVPGGFHSNNSHGPVTGNWLSFGGMKTVGWDAMMPGDIYVNGHHMGIVTGKGRGFAARSTATGTGPQTVPKGAYTIRRWPGGGGSGGGAGGNASLLAQALQGMLTMKYGDQSVGASVTAGSGSANLLTIARYMAGHGWSAAGAAGVAGNVYQESKGDPLSYGTGGRGLIGWTPPGRLPNSAFIPGNPSGSLSAQLPLVNSFFKSNMGRYWSLANAQSDPARAAWVIMNMGERPAGSSQSNPFYPGSGTSNGAARASIARDIYNKLKKSGGVKMAGGGILREPIAGIGRNTGRTYQLGEAGAERVSPLLAGGVTAEESSMLGAMRARGSASVINVYPRESQSETEIAAAVSREMGWAAAGGGAQ